MLRLAVIGLGGRAAGVIRTMIEVDAQVKVTGLVDPDLDHVRQSATQRGHEASFLDNVRVFPHVDALVEHADQFDGILIGTRCRLHTDMACKVAATGLPLYLEKPVSITRAQVERLAAAFEGRMDTVLVSFPLRTTPLFTAAMEVVRSGRLGTVNQIQANNNVPYGGVYYGNWYRNYDDTGGLWLQKATHDFDYLTMMLDRRPLSVAATASQLIYGGDKPHDLVCSQCDEVNTCIESHKNQTLRGDNGGMGPGEGNDTHWCCFSRDIQHQDAGSAMILYEGGAHVSYTQNFVSRRGAGKRGAVITGHAASLEFDWFTEQIIVRDHFKDRVDRIDIKASTGHAGGDHVLGGSFIKVMRGEAKAIADLSDGIRSAVMCLAARDSAYHRRFEPIVLPGEDAATLSEPVLASETPVA
jgi:predicted dehydrogenase